MAVSDLIAEGTLIQGRYRVQGLKGRGAMGCVYVCEHVSIGRKVALKVLHADIDTTEIRMRFEAEAKAASAAGHPNIVDVLDAGETEDGRPYIVMEFLDGRSLEKELRDEGAFGITRTCTIAREVAIAMAAAHKAGIVHRDLKPDNVMLLPDGRVKVVDFGIAYLTHNPGGKRFTTPGQGAFGTPEYMAPEQAAGQSASPAVDIYSLGVLMFEMLTGETPFLEATLVQTLSAKIERDAPSVGDLRRGLPRSLVALVDSCLARAPNKRPPSADHVRWALTPFVEHLGDTLEIRGVPAPSTKVAWRPGALAFGIAVLLGATATFLVVPSAPPNPSLVVASTGGPDLLLPPKLLPPTTTQAPTRRTEPPSPGMPADGSLPALTPIRTERSPIDSNLSPLAETPTPVTDNLLPVTDNLLPVTGNLLPVTGNLPTLDSNPPTVDGSLTPISGNLPTLDGNLTPVDGNPPPNNDPLATVDRNHEPIAPDVEPTDSPALPMTSQVQPLENRPEPVATSPETKTVAPACGHESARAAAARERHDWAKVLRYTANARCWANDTARRRLRVLALSEQHRFEECMHIAAGSADPETIRSAKLCALRLERSR